MQRSGNRQGVASDSGCPWAGMGTRGIGCAVGAVSLGGGRPGHAGSGPVGSRSVHGDPVHPLPLDVRGDRGACGTERLGCDRMPPVGSPRRGAAGGAPAAPGGDRRDMVRSWGRSGTALLRRGTGTRASCRRRAAEPVVLAPPLGFLGSVRRARHRARHGGCPGGSTQARTARVPCRRQGALRPAAVSCGAGSRVLRGPGNGGAGRSRRPLSGRAGLADGGVDRHRCRRSPRTEGLGGVRPHPARDPPCPRPGDRSPRP